MKILITIPVFNEEKDLSKNILILFNFLESNLKYDWEIVIADNGSDDKTQEIGNRLSKSYSNRIKYLRIEKKGRGRAIKKSWLNSNADILSYMDIDLSTNINAFPALIDEIINGSDIAIGSRLLKNSHTSRNLKREILSRGYNILVKLFFNNRFSDAQCGFKAINKRTVQDLLPKIKNDFWFFDTELLVLAEYYNYKIAEIPVEWIEDLDSKVKIIETALNYIKELFRLKFYKEINDKK